LQPTNEQITEAITQHGSFRAAERELRAAGFEISDRAIRKRAARGDLDLPTKFIRQKFDTEREPFIPEQHILKRATVHVKDGEVVQEWLKSAEDTEHTIAAIKAAFAEYKGKSKLVKAPKMIDRDLMSVYPIADQHNGLLSWGKETGEAYDLDIGVNRLRACMERVVAQSPASKQALILNLGDWQHNDDQRNMTPKSGNLLDVDGRYPKVLKAGFQLFLDVVDLALQKHEKVLVRNLPGNHDPHSSVALTLALAAFYANNPRVTVDEDPSEFFFHRFGATLLGACHGHRMKPDRMAMSLATRRPEDWGKTKFRWFLFGHIHHESVKEIGNVRCESFQTLAAKDAHHANSGYNSGQSLQSVTLHIEEGEIGRHRINV
jgi:hypothetical protein